MRGLASPRRILRSNLRDMRALLLALPGDVRALFARVRHWGWRIELDLERLDAFDHQIERNTNRMTVGLTTAALIVGTSIMMTVDHGPRILGLPSLGLIGFLSSGLLGAFLLWSILRSSRR